MTSTELLIQNTKNTVFGQDEAVEKTAEFINFALTKIETFEHFPHIQNIPKSNCMLLIGNTASGKTHLVKNICNNANLKLFYVDCSTLTPEGWKGGTVSTMLLAVATWQKEHENEPYVILWDEFDKDSFKTNHNSDIASANYMQNLLTVVESTSREHIVEVHSGITQLFSVDLYHAIHILAGSFPDIKNIIRKRIAPTTIGFQTKQVKETDEDILQKIEITDLIEFGIMPELIGRISNIIVLPTLNRDDFREILTERQGIINKYKMCCPSYEIKIEDPAIEHILDIAERQKLGARALEHEMSCIIPHAVHLLETAKQYENQVTINWENNTYTYNITTSECSPAGYTPTSPEYETKIGANKYMNFNKINTAELLKQLAEKHHKLMQEKEENTPNLDEDFLNIDSLNTDSTDIELSDIDYKNESFINTEDMYEDFIEAMTTFDENKHNEFIPEIIESTFKHGIACLYAYLEKYKTTTPTNKQLNMQQLESITSKTLIKQTSYFRGLQNEKRTLAIDLIELIIELAILRNKDELLWFLTNIIKNYSTSFYTSCYTELLNDIYDNNSTHKLKEHLNILMLTETSNKKLLINVLREGFGAITNDDIFIRNLSRAIKLEQNNAWKNKYIKQKKKPKSISTEPTIKYVNNFPYIAI